GDLGQSATAVGQPPGPVGRAHGVHVGFGALRADGGVVVEPADVLVEIQELLRRDGRVVQRRQAVLDADVVQGPSGEPGIRVDAVDVDGVVVHPAAHPVGIGVRVVPLLGRDAVAEGTGVDTPSTPGDVGSGGIGDETCHRTLLLFRPGHVGVAGEVVVEQPGVGDEVDGTEPDV